MNYGIILTGGVGQRMRSSGLPKQFLKLLGKPIVIYTLEKFENCSEIDELVVVCHSAWLDHMEKLLKQYSLSKVTNVVAGGNNRQESIKHGLNKIQERCTEEDIVVIHDGVRPLVSEATIHENIRVAKLKGNAMTVRAVTESVVVTENESANIDAFMKRDDTYSLISPQTFKVLELIEAYKEIEECFDSKIPLLDASIMYAHLGKKVNLVKVNERSIKITTPEDFYYLRAILELEENKYIFGF